MTNLNFFIPVTFLRTPGPFYNPLTKAPQLADEFFFWKDGIRAYEIEENNGIHKVQLIHCKTKFGLTAIKVALVGTPVFPIMLAIKLYTRYNTTFHVTNPNPSRERNELEPVIYTLRPITNRQEIDQRYSTICQKQGISYEKATALQKHLLFFTNNEGNFTPNSIQKGFERLGCLRFTSYLVANKLFSQISKNLNITASQISLNDMAKARHPSDTKVFTDTGEFNLEKYNHVVKILTPINCSFLAASKVKEMVLLNQERDCANADAGMGAAASAKEFDMTLNLFSDCGLVDTYGRVIKAISRNRLEQLYTEGPMLFEEVANRIESQA